MYGPEVIEDFLYYVLMDHLLAGGTLEEAALRVLERWKKERESNDLRF